MLGTLAALRMARHLEEVLAVLAAGAPPSEHFDLRLAEALAGNLADHLEAMAQHADSSSGGVPVRKSAVTSIQGSEVLTV